MSDAAIKITDEQKAELEAASKEAPEKKNPLLDKSLEKMAKAVTNARFGLADEAINRWLVTCEDGTTVEQLLDGSYWANVARSLRPGDEITVRPDDMSWEVVLHVAGAEQLFAHVSKKAFYKLTPEIPHELIPSRYTVKHGGSHHKWCVLRDGKPLKEGIETQAIAIRVAANHEAAQAR